MTAAKAKRISQLLDTCQKWNVCLLLTSQDAWLRKETCRAILLAHDDHLPAAAGPVLDDLRVCGLAIDIGIRVQFLDVAVAAAAARCKKLTECPDFSNVYNICEVMRDMACRKHK